MDIVEACRAFVSVSEHGSFTLGAASVRAPQSVVSRRIAALEKHLGDALFDRTSRRVALTPFGGDLLPSAKRLIELADALHHDAERAKRRPFRLAVPEICSPVDLARLDVEARQMGIYLDFLPAGPAARAELTRSLGVRAALIAVPANEGTWSVPLGLAGAAGSSAVAELPAGPVYLESLRPSRAQPAARTIGIWVQPEDDVPHVRDRLTRLRDSVALSPSQVAVAGSFTSAAAEVLDSADLLLCSPMQAEQLGLHWRPIGEQPLARGFSVFAPSGTDASRIRDRLWPAIARCLGSDPSDSMGDPSDSMGEK